MSTLSFPAEPELSERDLTTIRRLVYERSGIALHAGKRALVAARLQKRLRNGGFKSFREYIRFVQSDTTGDEVTQLLDAIATNHTAFFREPQHFEFLRTTVLPPLVASRRPIAGWSAACASGEEPYSIAMILLDALGDQAPLRTRLVASDLSTKALGAARAGIYRADRAQSIPRPFRCLFERGGGSQSGFVRAGNALRRIVEFRQINLLAVPPSLPSFQFIFCRNVMIYFDDAAQQRVVDVIERRLAPGGYLFISHAESLNGVRHGLKWVAPAVYQRVTW